MMLSFFSRPLATMKTWSSLAILSVVAQRAKSEARRATAGRLTLIFTLTLPSLAHAATHDSTPGVPVRIWGSAYGGANPDPAVVTVSSADDFLPDSSGDPSPLPLTGSRSVGGSEWFSTDVGTARMEPGKVYQILVDGVNAGSVVDAVSLHMAPPLGYEVEIDYVRRQRADHATSASHQYTVRLMGSREQQFMATGAATQLMVGRIYWQVGLGALRNGKAAGSLSIVDAGASANWSVLSTISALHYESPSPEIIVVPKAGGLMRQIVANQAVVDIVTSTEDASLTASQYELRFYHPDQATGTDLDVRTFTGQSYLTYRVEQGETATTLKITSTTRNTASPNWTGGVARTAVTTLARTGTSWPDFIWTRSDWNTSGATQVAEQIIDSGGTTAARTDTLVVQPGGGGDDATTLARQYQLYGWGEELVGSTAGSTNPMTTTYDYWDDPAEVGRYGFLKSIESPGGGWESYDYWDATSTVGTNKIGTLRYRYRPFTTGPETVAFNATSGEVTSYEFADDPFGVATRPTLVETSVGNTVTAKSATSYTEATDSVTGITLVTATRKDYHKTGETGSSYLTTITRFFREDTADLFLRNQIHSVTRPDNVKVAFAYQRGTWDGTDFLPDAEGQASRIATITGIAGTGYTEYGGYDIDDLSLVEGKSTLEVTIRDARALIVRTEAHAWATDGTSYDWRRVGSVDYTYDTMGRLATRIASNGATYQAYYDGEQKDYDIDESGVRADYEYDAAGRLSQVKKRNADDSDFTTLVTFAYDAAGRVTSETVTDSGDTLAPVVNSRKFDDAGRLVGETPAGMSPATTEEWAINHTYNVAGRSHTVATPDGVERTETYFRDGRMEKVTGDGVVPVYYAYSIDSSNGQRITEVYSGIDPVGSSPRKEKAWADWLGRPVKSQKPGFSKSAQAAFETENFYDDATVGLGRLYKTTRTGYAPTFYAYDALGMLIRSGLDMDTTPDGLESDASEDRISEQDQYVESYDSAYWLRTESRVYFPGEETARTTSVSRLRLTGHDGVLSEAREWDIEDQDGDATAVSTVAVNRATKTVTTTTTTAGLPVSEVATVVNGLATSFTGSDGLTYNSYYDALERLSREKDPRHSTEENTDLGYTVYSYKAGTGMIESIIDPAGHEVSTTTYDNMGRVTAVEDAAGKFTRYAYNARGQLHRQWGDAVRPVEYGYDPTYGDRTSLSTFRSAPAADSPGWPAVGDADTTEWDIDAATGLVWKKIDATEKEVEFDYNVRGQTASRQWARRVDPDNAFSDRVKATYVYDDRTGELTNVNYNDHGIVGVIATPDLAYAYDRLGRTTGIGDGTDSRSFVYDAGTATAKPWRLLHEELPAFYGSRLLTRLYDSSTANASGTGTLKGRSAGYELGVTGDTARDLRSAWAFTDQPRLNTISAALNGGAAQDFTYGYVDDSALLDGYTATAAGAGAAFTVSRDYEERRDLVTRLEAQWGTASDKTRTRFDYTYDALGRRQTAKQSGTAYADYYAGQTYSAVYTAYAYNDRGELESARMYGGDDVSTLANELPGRRFEYRYDSAGNRKSSGATGTSNGAIDSSGTGDEDYEINSLNQITSREHNRVTVAGTAATGANVAMVGTMSTPRTHRAWANTLEPDNADGPAAGTAQVYAAIPGTPTLLAGKGITWFVPKREQVLTYDLDGNLTDDGVWKYEWNAENQLVRITSLLPAGFGLPLIYQRFAITFKYDHAGRRVEKAVVDLDNASNNYTRRFVYDGWNLLAELNGLDGASSQIQRSYTWGLDNGGSLTTSSSPGSLLRITNYSSGNPGTSYYPTYDDQGNVASLINATSGDLAAVYEYDPYGNYLRNEVLDPAAADNPFRHSTKYHDVETGLVYYGYRYYDPKNGRFINKDPIGEAGGLNLYGFIGNSAVNGHDHLGMKWVTIRYVEYDLAVVNTFGIFGTDNSVTFISQIRIVPRIWVITIRYWVPDEEQPPPDTTGTLANDHFITFLPWENPKLKPKDPQPEQPGPGDTDTGTGTDTTGDTGGEDDAPSTMPSSVGFASGAAPGMPTTADRVAMPGEARNSLGSGWFGTNLSMGELAKAVISGAGEGLYDVTIGAAVDSYNRGVEHMAGAITAAQEGDYALAALHATATAGEVANLALTAVGAGEGAVALRNAGSAALRSMASSSAGRTAVSTAERAVAGQADDAARRAYMEGMCFVAGTPIATAGGVSVIDELDLGDRVLTENGGASWTEVDPTTWRTIRLRTVNPENPGDTIAVELLRPVEWMTTTGAALDTNIRLDLGEIGFHGTATVEAIEPCPMITPGSGRVVLATFTRLSSSVLQVWLKDAGKPLELTATHRLFSVTRGWIAAGELHDGEKLRTRTGTATVESVRPLPGTHRVFNVEVEAEHCYFAGEVQVLSHNNCAARGEPPQLARGKAAHKAEPVRPGERAEVRTSDGRGRMDRYDKDKAHIREIKPDNPRGRAAGQKQLERYKASEEAVSGREHTTELVLYPPGG